MVKSTGYIGVGSAQHFYDKHLLNGQNRPSINLFWQVNFIGSNEPKGVPIKRQYEPWLLNGYVPIIVIGKHEHRMMW